MENLKHLCDGEYENIVKLSCEKVVSLFKEYETDLDIKIKLHNYIFQQLPNILKTQKCNKIKNVQRVEEHSYEQKMFITDYLNKNFYYYHSGNETFYSYDGFHYKEISEDEIMHDIVTKISSNNSNPVLMNWKHKTKVAIIKKIKEKLIVESIPESKTIQFVISALKRKMNLTKHEVKYFLSVIGDNILKKDATHIHFIFSIIKNFLNDLNKLCLEKLNCSCTNTFKYKYHEKHQEQITECRLMPYFEEECDENYKDFLINYGMDFLCVAIYYSKKYGSSDNFILNCDDEFKSYVFYFRNNSFDDIVQMFKSNYLFDYETGSEYSSSSPEEKGFLQQHIQTLEDNKNKFLYWKEIQFLWKDFLKTNKLPFNLYYNSLKNRFINIYLTRYDEINDRFLNIGSSQIPFIQNFLTFWSQTMIDDAKPYMELEIEEVAYLFREWSKNKKMILRESKIIDILSYFKPDLELINDKYIYHVRCSLWDKDMEIENSLEELRCAYKNDLRISLYDAYKFYCTRCNSTQQCLVSKTFFEKYIMYQYEKYLDDDKSSFAIHNLSSNYNLSEISV